MPDGGCQRTRNGRKQLGIHLGQVGINPIRKRLDEHILAASLLAMASTRFALNRAERAEIMMNLRQALAVFDRREKLLNPSEIRVKSMLSALLSELERHSQYDGG